MQQIDRLREFLKRIEAKGNVKPFHEAEFEKLVENDLLRVFQRFAPPEEAAMFLPDRECWYSVVTNRAAAAIHRGENQEARERQPVGSS